MPKIVDHEEKRKEILMAFERCIKNKPADRISLRDIAREAGMSHPQLLHYFSGRDELLTAYCRYTMNYMSEHCLSWFHSHELSDYQSRKDYLNAFMQYVADGDPHEIRPDATVQTYVLGHYNKEIGSLVQEEFHTWKEVMHECLRKVYGEEAGEEEAEAMMVLIAGTFIANYNHALTGTINSHILDYFRLFLKDDMPAQPQ